MGTKIVSYTYDAWGNILSETYNSAASSSDRAIAGYNPYRYRGYYYDYDLGLYYLQTRYYDPQVGRFINVDALIAGVDGSIRGYNLYVYCKNNPVHMVDNGGNWPSWNEFWSGVGNFF